MAMGTDSSYLVWLDDGQEVSEHTPAASAQGSDGDAVFLRRVISSAASMNALKVRAEKHTDRSVHDV